MQLCHLCSPAPSLFSAVNALFIPKSYDERSRRQCLSWQTKKPELLFKRRCFMRKLLLAVAILIVAGCAAYVTPSGTYIEPLPEES
jgi:hypothetical protein